MEFTRETLDDVVVVRIPGGTLDAGNAKDFKSGVAPFLSHKKLVFDMSALEFVDSSGLGAILSCLREVNAAQGDLALCGLSRSVRTLFELVRLHRVFKICGTREEAAAALK